MEYLAISFDVLEVSLSIFASRTKDSLTELSTSWYFPSTVCFQPATHHTSPFYCPCTHSCKSEGTEKSSQHPHYCTKKSFLCWVVSICLCPVHDCAVSFSSAHVSVMPNWSNVLLWLESLHLWPLPWLSPHLNEHLWIAVFLRQNFIPWCLTFSLTTISEDMKS